LVKRVFSGLPLAKILHPRRAIIARLVFIVNNDYIADVDYNSKDTQIQ
jgi:hypothetical protein